MRRFICILLLMLLPLHGFAMQSGELGQHAYDFAHEIEHATDVSHHHEADGTTHYDQSDESVQHALDNTTFTQAVALPSLALPQPAAPPSSLGESRLSLLIPDGIRTLPIRPPCALG